LALPPPRGGLAAPSREAGTLAERERLAREIHHTVAQGLSSIQMLLHAAERDVDGERTRERGGLGGGTRARSTRPGGPGTLEHPDATARRGARRRRRADSREAPARTRDGR